MNRTTVDNSDFLNQSSQSNRLLLLWQKIYLQKDESAFNFSQSMRGFMQQIDIAKRLHLLSSSAFDSLLFSYDKLYADVIDDKKTGLNNFSAEALSLAKLKSTEIDKWRSGLNLDAVPKTLLKDNKMDLNQSEACSFLKTLRNNWKTSKLDSCKVQSINDVGQTSKSASAVFNPVQATDATKNVQSTSLKRKCISPEVGETVPKRQDSCSFRTAKEQLMVNNVKSGNRTLSATAAVAPSSSGSSKKSLGPRRGNVTGRFIPPLLSRDKEENVNLSGRNGDTLSAEEDDRLKNIDAKMIELITNEIMDNGSPVNWDDIAGLEFAKKTIKEIVVLPILRPDIFTGLRGPPKGLLLFGPPGTGKTLIGKCIASQSKSTFFSISASSLTSKWIGDGEKMVRALFAVARCHQPAVIFIDEIDSLLTQRSDSEHESSRRMKTEILIQLDGAATNSEDRILVVGATNRPQELDEAARRRLVKRLYIPLPELEARKQIVVSLLRHQSHSLTEENITDIGNRTAGYSGADMANLCKEAALGPIRCLSYEDIEKISPESVRPIIYNDFLEALHQVKASVSEADLASYLEWNLKFGSSSTNTTGIP